MTMVGTNPSPQIKGSLLLSVSQALIRRLKIKISNFVVQRKLSSHLVVKFYFFRTEFQKKKDIKKDPFAETSSVFRQNLKQHTCAMNYSCVFL